MAIFRFEVGNVLVAFSAQTSITNHVFAFEDVSVCLGQRIDSHAGSQVKVDAGSPGLKGCSDREPAFRP